MKIVTRTNLQYLQNKLIEETTGSPISLQKLAREIGHNYDALWKFDTGQVSNYSKDLLAKLLTYANKKGVECTISDLIIMEVIEERGEVSL